MTARRWILGTAIAGSLLLSGCTADDKPERATASPTPTTAPTLAAPAPTITQPPTGPNEIARAFVESNEDHSVTVTIDPNTDGTQVIFACSGATRLGYEVTTTSGTLITSGEGPCDGHETQNTATPASSAHQDVQLRITGETTPDTVAYAVLTYAR
ncbi:hypothetical protein [Microbacterium gorillae]|uniref:hypothetical protein n=1 Tax=Microbacterium gorillae TaxID=1231063 RepID=UPI00058BDF1E|nr:hypothetical protein [Microbacterium gorillae]